VAKKHPKTLILGLGNPILCDDGVGPAIARELEGKLDPQEATVLEASLGGLNLLDLLVGYERAIIIDAIKTGRGRAGQIYKLEPGSFATTRYTASPHDVNLLIALELGKKLNLAVPSKVDIFAIEVAETGRFSEECTPEVAAAIPACVEMVLRELRK
jgi:hydrogenase maturation protease